MKRMVLCLLVLFMIIVSCEQPPSTFDRDNTEDPLGSNFRPAYNGMLELNAQIVSKNKIGIIWTDTDDIATHYVIEKAFRNGEGEFVAFDTVFASVTSAIDSSNNVAANNYYRVAAYREESSSLRFLSVSNVSFVFIPDNFQVTEFIDGDSLRATYTITNSDLWDIETRIQIQEYDVFNTSTILVDTVLEKTEKTYVFDIPEKLADYEIEFYGILNGGQRPGSYESRWINTSQFFLPTYVSAELLNQEAARIRWNDRSSFETGFQILKYRPGLELDVVQELGPNVTEWIDSRPFRNAFLTWRSDSILDYGASYVVAIIDNGFPFFLASEPGNELVFSGTLNMPIFVDAEIDGNNVRLIFSDFDLFIEEFIIQEAIFSHGGVKNFQDVANIPSSSASYDVQLIDESRLYCYRVTIQDIVPLSEICLEFDPDLRVITN